MATVWFSIFLVVAALSQDLTAAYCNCGCSERITCYYPKSEIRPARVPLPYEPKINENQSNSVLLSKILSTLDAILATEKIIAAAVSRPVWLRPNPSERDGNKTESTISNTNGTLPTNTTVSPYVRQSYKIQHNA